MTQLIPEWAPQDGVMLTWPNDTNQWQPSLQVVEQVFVKLVEAIIPHEDVLISGLSPQHCDHIRSLLTTHGLNLSSVRLFAVPSHDVWARDHGPIAVSKEDKPLLLDFVFNAWGNKYPAEADNAITKNLQQQGAFGNAPFQSISLVLEGGSIETDGQGTLLTTSSCLLNKNRNNDLSQSELENLLKQHFGIQQVLWLDHGHMEGDDTDGHIDTLARFIDPNTICYMHCDDPVDEHYETMQEMKAQLETFKNIDGDYYRLIPLPWPQPYYNKEGERLPNTYANFLIINNAVLLPTYGDSKDAIAVQTLQPCFPDRKIVPIACQSLIEQFGSLHCVTMQLPKGVLINE